MSTKILITYTGSDDLYCTIQRESDLAVWNGSAFETWLDGNYSTYALALSNLGGITYGVEFPSSIPINAEYFYVIRIQPGSSPVITDRVVGDSIIATWTGSDLSTVTDVIGETDTTNLRYQTVTQAQSYFDGRLNTNAWDEATNSNRNKALLQATNNIDALPLMDDYIFTNKQDSSVPDDIKYACNLIALALLDGVEIEQELIAQSKFSTTFTNIKEVNNANDKLEHLMSGIPSAEGWRYLKPYLRKDNLILRRV